MANDPLPITPGARVRVAVPEGIRDPWLSPKQGWEGYAVEPAINMNGDAWQIRFVDPWCNLNMTRVMPVTALVVLDTPKIASSTAHGDAHLPQMAVGGDVAALGEASICEHDESTDVDHATVAEVAPCDCRMVADEDRDVAATAESCEAAEKSMEDEDPPEEEDHDPEAPEEVDSDETEDSCPESAVPETNAISGMAVGAWVRVRDKAGATGGEEHIIRRRGQVGTVRRVCTSCAFVEVEFAKGELWVMIPTSHLLTSSAAPGAGKAALKTGAQKTLPFGLPI